MLYFIFPDPLFTLPRNIAACGAAIQKEMYIESILLESGINYLLTAEKLLLDMSCVCQGVIFNFIVQTGQDIYIRYFEAGVFDGFTQLKSSSLVPAEYKKDEGLTLLWKTYTKVDQAERSVQLKDRATSIGSKRKANSSGKYIYFF